MFKLGLVCTVLTTLSFRTQEANSLAIDSKLELPEPRSLVTDNNDMPAMDSSLSPKIIKAFYEINFEPIATKMKNSDKTGYIALKTSSENDCTYDKKLCEYLYFMPSKVTAVQKIEDLIEENKDNGDVPVVSGIANRVDDVEELMKEINRTISEQVNKKIATSSEVPIYKGVVKTDTVLKSPEHPEPHAKYPHGSYYPYPYRPYYPPPTMPVPWYGGAKPWFDQQPRPCLHSPCPTQWKTLPTLKLK